MPGVYDLQVVSKNGLSSPRLFAVSHRAERVETEPNNDAAQALAQPRLPIASLPGGTIINGRLDSAGDVDVHAVELVAGQTIVLECWARRLDSKMRAVIELRDAAGRRVHPASGTHRRRPTPCLPSTRGRPLPAHGARPDLLFRGRPLLPAGARHRAPGPLSQFPVSWKPDAPHASPFTVGTCRGPLPARSPP